jgi:maltooligosyltrehalose synthase
LKHRRLNRARYDRGDHLPLSADGERARHVVAFARTLDGRASLTLVGRFDPPVATIPLVSPEVTLRRLRSAAQLAAGESPATVLTESVAALVTGARLAGQST